MEHAIRHEIHVKLEEDPAYYQTLRERLIQIIEDRKARRIDEAEQLSLLKNLVDDVRGHGEAAKGEGMSETAFAVCGLLKGAQVTRVTADSSEYGDDRTREIANTIEHTLEAEKGSGAINGPFVQLRCTLRTRHFAPHRKGAITEESVV